MQATHPRAFLALLLLLPTCRTVDPAWNPKPGPLVTRFAKDVDPAHPLPEYPRPQMTRKDWLSLNGTWEFQDAKEGEPPPFGHALAERILVPFPVESALSGIARPAERVWYRKTFLVPHAWTGRRTMLHFGAVDWECRVFVNGRELLVHRGGYDPFSVDITPALASPGPQEVVLGVFDPSDAGEQPRGKQVREPKGIWYTSTTGVWQTVWLEPVGVVHVDALRVDPDPKGEAVELVVDAPRATPEDHVEVDVLEGNRVLSSGRGRSNDRIRIPLPGARRWSPEDPFLYDLEVRLVRGPVLEDTVRSYFGMRTIEVLNDEKGVPRLALNGKPLFMIGVLDQGFWPDGIYTAPTDEALKSDIELAKKLGFNLIRKHVKVEPERWYAWADRLGMLVWQDMPSGFREDAKGDRIELRPDSPAQFRDELKRLLESRRGHPSIVQWIVFNEGWGQHATTDDVGFVKGFDRSRLVTGASGWTDDGSGDVVDIHAYPGPLAPKTESVRAAVLGEFGGLGLATPGHMWKSENWGYRGTADAAELTDGYVNLLRRVHELKETSGLAAAIYTQLTDVEIECNGLATYDRAVVKPDVERVRAANEGRIPKLVPVVPTSEASGIAWRYRFDAPANDWIAPGFDDREWTEGPGGFGTEGTPGAVVRTTWSTPDIWLRRTFELQADPEEKLFLLVHHDEDVEIFLNGVLATKAARFTTGYEPLAITPEARAALVAGANTIAIHCRQTTGGQYVDAGIVAQER